MNATAPKKRDGLRGSFWLPLAALLAVEIYARNFDGWGAWATAPLFLLPGILGLVIGSAGAFQAYSEFRLGNGRPSTLWLSAIAVSPVAWLMVRRYFA